MIRKVEPQWGLNADGKSIGNLGTFKVNTALPTPADVQRMLDKSPAAFCEVLGGQLHIKFSGPMLKRLVMEKVKEEMPMHDGEKPAVYAERTYERAREIAARDLPGMQLDHVAEFVRWVDESYNQRGARVDDYVRLIREKWATSTNEKRLAFIRRFDLGLEITATADEVEKAYLLGKEEAL